MNPGASNPDLDPLDVAAQEAFDRTYGNRRLAAIAIIIPAFREVESIGDVLKHLPAAIAGHGVTTLVVVDGPDDGTREVAQAAGALVTATGGHRGQGAALRLGYRLAADHGSEFLVTLDADGQYLAAEIPSILEPLLKGEADFVSGSRRLGADETTDRVRSLGIDVFATVIRILTGHPVTDPAFGLRALTAEVARRVTLRQPQYQASELLIGAILRGFRVTERPGTMRRRAAAESRKGGNLRYGYRFGRVVFTTWWRERGDSTEAGLWSVSQRAVSNLWAALRPAVSRKPLT